MPVARNPRLKPLKELAAAVGAQIKVEYTGLGEGQYVLLDKGERVGGAEYDTFDMLDTIQAYYGGHPNYKEARIQFNYVTGEEE